MMRPPASLFNVGLARTDSLPGSRMSSSFTERPHQRGTPTVMLIEAEPMLRLTMTEFLHRAGCQVLACPDAQMGAAALANGTITPMLILVGARELDVKLAVATRRLRELAPRAAILGIADVVDPAVSAELPVDLRFLAPPFDLPDVLRAVQSHLRQAGALSSDSELLQA